MVPLAVAALVSLTAEPVAPAADESLARMLRGGELLIGADAQGGEPFVFHDAADPARLVGFEVDIAEAVGRRLHVRARFIQTDWSTLVPSLERGDFDVAMNGIEETAERRERLLLSLPYFAFGETLAVREGDPRARLADLAGERVGTLNQSLAFAVLREGPATPVLYEGVSEPYLDLAAGRLSGVLLDHVIAARYGCGKSGVRCLPEDVARGAYVAAFRRGDARLRDAFDDALRSLRDAGELRAILERWNLWDSRQATLADPAARAGALSGTAPERAPRGPDATAGGPPTPRGWSATDTRLFLDGAAVTVGISAAAFALALPLGLVLALGRLSARRGIRAIAAAYVEVFRGTPLLLQLYLLYFGLAPLVRLGPVVAAVLGLGLNYAAYEAEIHRGALLAVPRGQEDAARALGLTRWQSLRHVLLPQSLRIALPSVTNDFVALLKDSSLVSVITVVELTKRMTIAAVDLRGWLLPGLACAALYFAVSFPLARFASRLERGPGDDQRPRAA